MTAQAGMFPVTSAERHHAAAANNNSGLQRKARGQAAVVDAEAEQWKADTLFLLLTYLTSLRPGDKFAFEDVRAYMDTCGHRDPRSHKIWGALPGMAKAAGLPIRMTDQTRAATSPRTHGHRISIWMRTG